MRSRISLLCDQIMEAGWLLALIVVPLFFNVYSSRVFEPDKLSLLRSIATLLVVCGIVKAAEKTPSSEQSSWRQRLEGLFEIPLVLPTILFGFIYLLTTATSIVPRISFWGSYQRLQGTYTMLSYLVVFFVLLGNLRRREQLDRLLTIIVLVSLPIALYGLVQHYGLDPLPWGGDVTRRVASNMGNPIFVAAYLIMIVPLTLARMIALQRQTLKDERALGRIGFAVLPWALLLVQLAAWGLMGFGRGIVTSLLILLALGALGMCLRRSVASFLLLGTYSIVLSAQLMCIFFSQSRGPLIGLMAGLFFFGLLYLFMRRRRRTLFALIMLSIVLAGILVIMNLPASPLAQVRRVPYIGRLGRLFEIEGGTGKVRVLIWQGAVELLKANPGRALIGYGPESMYLAYNKYYPPDLAHYEARNASPDRAHNETFDALVMTGVIGFLVYIALFIIIFYQSFRWLRFIHTRRQKWLFLICNAAGAILGLIVPPLLDGSLRFIGVGIPVGLIVGLAGFVTISAVLELSGKSSSAQAAESEERGLLLIAILAAIIAHFVEIHFGIAIAATRLYFWTFVALLVILGRSQVGIGDQEQEEVGATLADASKPLQTTWQRRKARRRQRVTAVTSSASISRAKAQAPLIGMAYLLGFMLATMCWAFVTNPQLSQNPFKVLAISFTTMAARRQPEQTNWSIFGLLVTTFLVGLVAIISENAREHKEEIAVRRWLASAGIAALVAGGSGLLFALIHAGRLGPGTNAANLIYEYYVAAALSWVCTALALRHPMPRPDTWSRGALVYAYPILPILALLFINLANVRIIKADVVYKQGQRFEGENSWDSAIQIYRKAIEIAPNEDYYYLFYGRALLERAKLESNAQTRQAYFLEALAALQEARELNPLNTDHTANLARLHRNWAEIELDAEQRKQKLLKALSYYKEATQLSPNNAQLYNEWGLVYYLLGDVESALAKYEQSLKLDDRFDQTYVLIGDIYLARKDWPRVIASYKKAVELNPRLLQGWSALGYAYSQLGQVADAITANLKILEYAPQDYGTLKNLAILYNQEGSFDTALSYAEQALAGAPQEEKQVLEGFVAQLKAHLGQGQ